MAENWRDYAERGKWYKIEAWRLSSDDAVELAAMLQGIVPRRRRGHGVETFEGWIFPHEATNYSEYYSAECLMSVQRRLRSLFEPKRVAGQVFKAAIDEAIRTIRRIGIDYQGMHNTYLYYESDRGLHQLDNEFGRAIMERQRQFMLDTNSDPVVVKKWMNLYPWRRCMSLAAAWRGNAFEYNSPMDHALHILNLYEFFREGFVDTLWGGKSVGLKGGRGRVQRAHGALDFAKLGFEIGRHYEALLKKPYEEHAVKRMETVRKNRENGKRGGQADIKRQRFETLNNLAYRERDRFAFASDDQAARKAKELAKGYEANARDGLFLHADKLLSLGWFKVEWLPQFREGMRRERS